MTERPLRIGIDCRMTGSGEGIGRYVEELVRNLNELDRENEYCLLVSKNSKFQIPNSKPFQNSNFKIINVSSSYYSFMEQTYFIWELMRLKLDLVHFPSFNVPILYPGKFVITVHDLIHHEFPGRKKSRFAHRLAYRLVFWMAVHRAARIISVSENTKRELVRMFMISPSRIDVIYEGVSKISRKPYNGEVAQKFAITKPYLLFVGVWRQYKNLPRLAAAFDILKEHYDIDCQLVLAGKIDPFYPEIYREVMTTKHSSDIKPVGYVTDEALAGLYREARAFVLPSLTEGFGLIGIEAASVPLPVAASDIPVLREILGRGAIFFNERDPRDMAAKISTIWSDEAVRKKLMQVASSQALRYDWEICARQTLAVYNQ